MTDVSNMMRPIKFKAWLPDLKQIGMVTNLDGSNTEYKFFRATIETRDAHGRQVFYTASDFVLLAFTGLVDKNGKEIYEGDIVKAHDHPEGIWDQVGDVYYGQGRWRVRGSIIDLADYGTVWLEVIGNIYEK